MTLRQALPSLITALLFAVVAACSGPADPLTGVCVMSLDAIAHCSP